MFGDIVTCDHYAPPRSALQHEGSEPNPDFDYEENLDIHVCLHKENTNEDFVPTCNWATKQDACPLYSSEKNKTVLRRAVTKDIELEFSEIKTRFNFVGHSVVRHYRDDEGQSITDTSFLMNDHENLGSFNDALDCFHNAVEEFGATEEAVDEPSAPPTLLEKVMS